MKIKDIAHLNKRAGMYALFGEDGHLYLTQADGPPVSVAHLPCISTVGLVKLYVHEPWACVTERFGTHAALIHLENANVRKMNWEDYHADVSSYSIGFLERDGRVLIIHQTEWNRLDIIGSLLKHRPLYRSLRLKARSDVGLVQRSHRRKRWLLCITCHFCAILCACKVQNDGFDVSSFTTYFTLHLYRFQS